MPQTETNHNPNGLPVSQRGFDRTDRISPRPLLHDIKKKEDPRMNILDKLASIIGALLFFTLVVVVGLAFVDYIRSGHEKTVRGRSPGRFLP